MTNIPFECPNCGNHDCSENARYCFNCGNEIGNYCENPDCVSNSGKTPKIVSRTHCYCEACGGKTRNMRLGYITPRDFARAEWL